MIIKLLPQMREYDKIWYEITEDVITITINDVTDTFDFTDIPDGKLQLYDDEGESAIESILSEVPIVGAEKTDGVLTVEIIFSLDDYERDQRLLFPEPMTVEEFNALMKEREVPDGEDDVEGQ